MFVAPQHSGEVVKLTDKRHEQDGYYRLDAKTRCFILYLFRARLTHAAVIASAGVLSTHPTLKAGAADFRQGNGARADGTRADGKDVLVAVHEFMVVALSGYGASRNRY